MRECGSCKVCCCLPDLKEEMGKPAWTWCDHCDLSGGERGCRIYDERPEACKRFECFWLRTPQLPDSYRPDKCKVLITTTKGKIVLWNVYPGAIWKKKNKKLLKWLLINGGDVWVRRDRNNPNIVEKVMIRDGI